MVSETGKENRVTNIRDVGCVEAVVVPVGWSEPRSQMG